ncbi:MAG TPA: hypothetical protein VHG28_08205 [Longimicrobiaceae bacterium]|nr:hypothetical protein [Longimicrobiaceae bacterium]
MRYNWLRLTALPAIALALWSCDSPRQGDLQELVGPSARPSASSSGNGYRLLRGNDGWIGTSTALIGSGGGVLQLGEHELTVPSGAVSAPTLFTMTLEDAEHIRVELTATRALLLGGTLDVGKAGFARPVRLKLGFARATETFDVSTLSIAWTRPDGTLEVFPTEVNPSGKQARAELDHFSGYAVVVPRSGGE